MHRTREAVEFCLAADPPRPARPAPGLVRAGPQQLEFSA
jgi:hypothetical protein